MTRRNPASPSHASLDGLDVVRSRARQRRRTPGTSKWPDSLPAALDYSRTAMPPTERSSSNARTSPAVNAPPASGRLRALTQAHAEQGDVFRFRLGLMFAHPDAVRDVLVTNDRCFVKSPALRKARFTLGNGLLTNEGPTYRRQRALIQPSLHPKALSGYAEIMARHAAEAAGRWQDGRAIDAHREMMHLTLAIVAEALFGKSVGPEVSEIGLAMDLNVGMFRILTSPWGRLKVLLPTPFMFRFLFARRRLVGTLRRFIAERRASGVERDDLLARLLKARDADADGGGGMTETQLVDECVTLFAAGHETTANALTFTLWLLSQHPVVMERLRDEARAALGDTRLPGIDDLDDLPYARMVVAEAMRLYPPAWIVGRQAKEACEIAGRRVKRGAVVFISQWLTHHDARWWADPQRFDPERFAPGRHAERPRWAYFPFGGGSRQCVGEAFAWAEAVLVLAVIVRRWRVGSAEAGPLQLEPSITLRPAGEVRVVPRSWG